MLSHSVVALTRGGQKKGKTCLWELAENSQVKSLEGFARVKAKDYKNFFVVVIYK